KLFREREKNVKWVIVLLEKFYKSWTMGFLGPNHDVESSVVTCARRIRRKGQTHSIPQRFQSALDDLRSKLLVAIVLVAEGDERKQRHLNLLWQRQTRRVVERHASAISYHSIDELQTFRMKGERTVPGIQLFASILR